MRFFYIDVVYTSMCEFGLYFGFYMSEQVYARIILCVKHDMPSRPFSYIP